MRFASRRSSITVRAPPMIVFQFLRPGGINCTSTSLIGQRGVFDRKPQQLRQNVCASGWRHRVSAIDGAQAAHRSRPVQDECGAPAHPAKRSRSPSS
jgi:hypothetical protein